MIRIISDDIYFCLGALETLKLAGHQTSVIDKNHLIEQIGKIFFCQEDIIILSSNDKDIINNTISISMICKAKLIVVIDDNIPCPYGEHWTFGVMQKKTPIFEFPKIIESISKHDIDWLKDLTLREMEVLNELLKQKPPRLIATQMRVSEKTISAHKTNALKKLGLRQLNSRAIIIYGNYMKVLEQRLFH